MGVRGRRLVPPGLNIDKMHSGIPLTDEDRWPWLDAVAAWIDTTRRSGGHGVIACSALKRSYRDVLIGDRADVRLVYLKGDETLIARRIATRHEHFMPRSLAAQPIRSAGRAGAGRKSDHRLDRTATARDRGADFVSDEHGRRCSPEQPSLQLSGTGP